MKQIIQLTLLLFTFCLYSAENAKLAKTIQLQKKYAIKNLDKAFDTIFEIDEPEYKELNEILKQVLNNVQNHEFNKALSILRTTETGNNYLNRYLIVTKKILNNINKLLKNAFTNVCPEESKYPEVLSQLIIDYIEPFNYEIIKTIPFQSKRHNILQLIYSPTDNSKIAAMFDDATIRILNINADGWGIAFSPKKRFSRLYKKNSYTPTYDPINLRWSPDGSKLAYLMRSWTEFIIILDSNNLDIMKYIHTNYKNYNDIEIKWSHNIFNIIVKMITYINPKIESVTWSPNNTLLAAQTKSSGKFCIKIFPSKGDILKVFDDGWTSQWNPTQPLIAFIRYGNIEVWDTNSWQLLNTIKDENISQFSWSADGDMLITADNKNKQIKIWARTF